MQSVNNFNHSETNGNLSVEDSHNSVNIKPESMASLNYTNSNRHSTENLLNNHQNHHSSNNNNNNHHHNHAHQNGSNKHNHDSKLTDTTNLIHNSTNTNNDVNYDHNQSNETASSGNSSSNSNTNNNLHDLSNGNSLNGNFNTNNNNSNNNSSNNTNNNNNNNDNNEHISNGSSTNSQQFLFSNGQKDILRLIGQHLRYLGLNKTTETLIKESGCMLEHPIAANFCSLIMNGNWDQAEMSLNTLKPIMDDSNADITNMKFLILEQKYLECLEDGKILDALKCLRDELAPLKYNIDRLHELSSFLMCSDQLNLKTLSKWAGKSAISRQNLMDKLQSYLPPNVMLPPRRLETLLTQSIDYQCDKCPYHNVKDKGSLDSWSFLRDHVCTKDDFPSVTLQIISDHNDEVWICKFSNNGKKLATGSKDGCLFIWDVDSHTYKLTLNKCYEDHTCGVGWVTWSPDDRYIIACGTEESTELWIWDIENKVLKKRLNNNHDDSLTCAAWLPDGQTFVAGGAKGQFYFCDLDGNIRDTWEGIRVKFLQTLPDGLVLAADSLKRIRSYNFKEISDANLIQEDFQIMSFTLNRAANLVLISLANQGLHLWDVKDRVLVHRYQGAIQNSFMSYGTFGGIDENFIASGSEDTRVYIWNKRNEQAICVLEGHTRNVSCVSWNPVHLGMIASSSDDGTVRIWGPKNKQNVSSLDITNVNSQNIESNLNDHADNLSDNVNTSANNNTNINSTNNTNIMNNQIGNNIIGSAQLHNLASSSFNVPATPNYSISTVPQQYTSANTASSSATTNTNRSDRSTPV